MDFETLRRSPILREILDDHDREVMAQLVAEGKAEGKAQGKAEAKAESVLRILDARSIQLSAEQRERISTCTDIDQLDAWLDAAHGAACAADVFAALAPLRT